MSDRLTLLHRPDARNVRDAPLADMKKACSAQRQAGFFSSAGEEGRTAPIGGSDAFIGK
jgi:hypothetical protein